MQAVFVSKPPMVPDIDFFFEYKADFKNLIKPKNDY